MQKYLDDHPEHKDTFELLESIDKQNLKASLTLIDREDLKLYKYIYKHRLYLKKEIFDYLSQTLNHIITEEKRRLSDIENSCNQIGFMHGNFMHDNFMHDNNHIEKLRNRLYASKNDTTLLNLEDGFMTLETKILTVLLQKEIFLEDFHEKMFFMNNFKGLEKLFRIGEDREFIIQDLFDKIKKSQDTLEDKVKLNNEILKVGDKILLYFHFLSPFLTSTTRNCVFEKVPVDQKSVVLNEMTEKEASKKIAEVLLRESPKNKILFLNSIEIQNKPMVYFYLSRSTQFLSNKENCLITTQSLSNKENCSITNLRKHFLETLDILKILPIERRLSLLVLIGWAKAFVYHKDIEEGLSLYKKLIKIIGKEEEGYWVITTWDYTKDEEVDCDIIEDITVLSEFYDSVTEYKRTGYLNFENFKRQAEKCKDTNPFCFYKWEEILTVYKLNDD